MTITRKTIEYVADLARLKIKEEEMDRLVADMSKILSYVETLNRLDTNEVAPKEHVIPMHNVFRKDEVKKSFDVDLILRHVVEREGDAVKVPGIVEREEP